LSSLPEIFSPDGPLAQAISGYRMRGQQLDMAERIKWARLELILERASDSTIRSSFR